MAETTARSCSLAGQRLEQRTDCRPELFLDLDGGGIRKPVWHIARCFHRSKDPNGQFSIGVILVASSVMSKDGRSHPGDLEQFGQPAAFVKIIEEPMPFCVDVRPDVMWIWPVRWLSPTLLSNVTAPIHRGTPLLPSSQDLQKRT